MPTPPETSDRPLLDLIRRRGPTSVADLASATGVTATAVRVRLARLVESGLVDRRAESVGRGRPRYTYEASADAHRLGQNYTDLAGALWAELMQTISDRKLRRLLFVGVTERLAEGFRAELTDDAWEGRLEQLGTLLHRRGVEAEVVTGPSGSLPVLRQHTCPYYELAEVDPVVCSLERKMFEKALGHGLRLSRCRLDGQSHSCDFEAKAS